jgi:HEXXH motif-containing protein
MLSAGCDARRPSSAVRVTTSTPSHDLPAVHASIASVDALLDARRTLYQLAAELLRPEIGLSPLDWNILDSPSFRGRLGRAFAAGDARLCDDVVPLDAVVVERGWLRLGPRPIPVASQYDVNQLLSDAMDSVSVQLTTQTTNSGSLRLLTDADGERFTSAFELVGQGIAVARSIDLALLDDLLAHVALVGIVDPESTGELASASTRSFPGFVLLSPPDSAIEAAEWMVHEAAHQKLFDLAITGSMLTVESDSCAPFEPSWPPVGRQWPLEQTLAAGHAYACMAQFVDNAGKAVAFDTLGSQSLFPVARERADVIGGWLLERGEYLGADAHALLAGMHGRWPVKVSTRRHSAVRTPASCTVEPGLTIRRCTHGGKALVGRRSQPPELYVVTEEVASLLELLAGLPYGEAIQAFVRRHGTAASNAGSHMAERLAVVMTDMVELGLIRLQPVG